MNSCHLVPGLGLKYVDNLYGFVKLLSAVAVDMDMGGRVDDRLDTTGHTVDQRLLSDPAVISISSLKSDKGPDESTDVNLT